MPQDYAEAVRWYRKAADQGWARAEANIGLMYEQGRGVPQDYAEAVRRYRQAADQGWAWAEANLGWMYAQGHGVPQDDAEALRWDRKAADQGDAQGETNLGFLYEQGHGVPQDYRRCAGTGRQPTRATRRARPMADIRANAAAVEAYMGGAAPSPSPGDGADAAR